MLGLKGRCDEIEYGPILEETEVNEKLTCFF